MISLGNVGSENETTSEKNLTEVHFVVTNTYGRDSVIDPSEHNDWLQEATN